MNRVNLVEIYQKNYLHLFLSGIHKVNRYPQRKRNPEGQYCEVIFPFIYKSNSNIRK